MRWLRAWWIGIVRRWEVAGIRLREGQVFEGDAIELEYKQGERYGKGEGSFQLELMRQAPDGWVKYRSRRRLSDGRWATSGINRWVRAKAIKELIIDGKLREISQHKVTAWETQTVEDW